MDDDALESAKAIDAALASDLRAIGVHDLRELRAVGAAEAWERLLAADLRDTLTVRLALEAAVRGRASWALDPEVRERCAEHVRRRRAPEPPAPRVASRFSASPPAYRDPHAERDRRRVVLAVWVLCLPIIAFLIAKLVV